MMSLSVELIERSLTHAAVQYRLKHKQGHVDVAIPRLMHIFTRYWQAQGGRIVSALPLVKDFFQESASFDSDVDRILQLLSMESFWRDDIADILVSLFSEGSAAVVADQGVAAMFDVANPRAVDWSRAHAGELLTRLDDTTREDIREKLTYGREQGMSYQTLAAEIRDEFDSFSNKKRWNEDTQDWERDTSIQDRADLTARTETAYAYEAGSYDMIQELIAAGLEYEKAWFGGSCPKICLPNIDQEYIPVDEDFQSGDPYPPGHPNCECTTLYQRVEGGDDKAALPSDDQPQEDSAQ